MEISLNHLCLDYTLQFLALFISRKKARQYMIFLQDLRDLKEMQEMKKMTNCNNYNKALRFDY